MAIASILKERTAELHRRAETHPFQKALVKGDLTVAAYGAYLAQMLHVHRVLEDALRSLAQAPPIRGVVEPGQFRERNLLDDLAALGAGEETALPGTSALVSQIDDLRSGGDGPALLGMHYVLEGSTNGGRFIARALRHAYGIGEAGGLSYMDPYGEEQPARWAAFREALEREVDEAMGERTLGGAMAMFEGIIAVMEDLAEAHGVTPPMVEIASRPVRVD